MGARFKAAALLLACATTVSVAIAGLQTAASAEMHPLGVSVHANPDPVTRGAQTLVRSSVENGEDSTGGRR